MQDTFIYRPMNSFARVVSPIFKIGEIICLLAVGSMQFSRNAKQLVCLAVIVIFILFSQRLVRQYLCQSFIFQSDTLCVISDNHRYDRCISAENIPYACLAQDHKRVFYFVLSPHPLSRKEVRRLIYSLNPAKALKESVVVIPMEFLQNTAEVEQWVHEHIPHVETCDWQEW